MMSDKITHFDNSDNDFCDNVITKIVITVITLSQLSHLPSFIALNITNSKRVLYHGVLGV
jgi:hypothetical protein